MDVLVVGGGGREHAICWSLNKSQRVNKLFCAPGNGGISKIAQCVDIAATDIDKIVKFSKETGVSAPGPPLILTSFESHFRDRFVIDSRAFRAWKRLVYASITSEE